MTPPEVVRRIKSRKEKENQNHGLRSHQEMDHGSDQYQ